MTKSKLPSATRDLQDRCNTGPAGTNQSDLKCNQVLAHGQYDIHHSTNI